MTSSSSSVSTAEHPFAPWHNQAVWVDWQEKDGRKVPYKPGTNFRVEAKINDPSTWDVVANTSPDYYGIVLGFDLLCGIDIDGCRDPATGVIDDWAMKWVRLFNSYTEVSPSGTGIKIFVLSSGPSPLRNACSIPGEQSKLSSSGKLKAPGIELYDSKRYFTVTCNHLEDTCPTIERRDEEWATLVAYVAAARSAPKKATRAPSQYAGRDDAIFRYASSLRADGHDEASIERLCREKNTADSDLHPNFQIEGPLDDRTFTQKIQQALKYEPGHPGPNGELAKMNKEYTVLTQEGNKFRIMTWTQSEVDPTCQEYVLLTRKDFEDGHMHIKIPTADKPVPLGRWWLSNPGRRQFKSLTFEPRKPEIINNKLNIWRGFGFEPAPGDWSILRNHITEVLTAGNEPHAEYIVKWMAWAVQHPGEPARVALVFQGGQQTGKGTLGRTMARLFGRHGVHLQSADHIIGRFNSLLHQCCLLFADEVSWAGDRAASKLKAFITEPTINIERKGIDPVPVRNCLHIIMASNKDWVVPVEIDDWRFAIFRISDHRAHDEAYFDPLFDQLENGGYEALLYDLLAYDLGTWRPFKDIPETEAKEDQKEYSDPTADWRDLVDRAIREAIANHDGEVKGWKMLCSDMRRLINDDMRFWTGERQSLLGRALKDIGILKQGLSFRGYDSTKKCYYWGDSPRVIIDITSGDDRRPFARVQPWENVIDVKPKF